MTFSKFLPVLRPASKLSTGKSRNAETNRMLYCTRKGDNQNASIRTEKSAGDSVPLAPPPEVKRAAKVVESAKNTAAASTLESAPVSAVPPVPVEPSVAVAPPVPVAVEPPVPVVPPVPAAVEPPVPVLPRNASDDSLTPSTNVDKPVRMNYKERKRLMLEARLGKQMRKTENTSKVMQNENLLQKNKSKASSEPIETILEKFSKNSPLEIAKSASPTTRPKLTTENSHSAKTTYDMTETKMSETKSKKTDNTPKRNIIETIREFFRKDRK